MTAANTSRLWDLEICPSQPLEASLVHSEVEMFLCPRPIDAAAAFPFMFSFSSKHVS